MGQAGIALGQGEATAQVEVDEGSIAEVFLGVSGEALLARSTTFSMMCCAVALNLVITSVATSRFFSVALLISTLALGLPAPCHLGLADLKWGLALCGVLGCITASDLGPKWTPEFK